MKSIFWKVQKVGVDFMTDIKKIRELIDSYYKDYYRLNYIYYEWAIDHGTQDTTLFVLHEIFDLQDQCTQRQVTENTGYPKQTVSFIMRNLEKKGIIYRERSTLDKRNYLVKLTEYGNEFTKKIISEMKNNEIEAYQSMTEEERQIVTSGLKILADSLENSFRKKVK